MHVIGHHTPSMHHIPLTVEMKQSVLHGVGQSVIAKKAGTITAVEKVLDTSAPFDVGFLGWARSELIAPACEYRLWQ